MRVPSLFLLVAFIVAFVAGSPAPKPEPKPQMIYPFIRGVPPYGGYAPPVPYGGAYGAYGYGRWNMVNGHGIINKWLMKMNPYPTSPPASCQHTMTTSKITILDMDSSTSIKIVSLVNNIWTIMLIISSHFSVPQKKFRILYPPKC